MPISAKVASLFHRSLPIVNWISGYRREWLLSDVFAGLALWAVMVPEAMAYAGIVGVPPIMGLYTIVPALLAVPSIRRHAHGLGGRLCFYAGGAGLHRRARLRHHYRPSAASSWH